MTAQCDILAELRCTGAPTGRPEGWVRIMAAAPVYGDYPGPVWIIAPDAYDEDWTGAWLPIDDPDAGYEYRLNGAPCELEDALRAVFQRGHGAVQLGEDGQRALRVMMRPPGFHPPDVRGHVMAGGSIEVPPGVLTLPSRRFVVDIDAGPEGDPR